MCFVVFYGMMLNGYIEVKVEEIDWEYEYEFVLLDEDFKFIVDKCCVDEMKKMVNVIEVS